MNKLYYELFTGVGFCNQIFSLETAIYLANIMNRKLILIVTHPLCHIGKADWKYGKILDFFNNDFKNFLPNGYEIKYQETIKKYLNLEHQIFKSSNKFSRVGFIDKELDIPENQEKIKFFLSNREKVIFDLNFYNSENVIVKDSNASRCFYNFFTTKENYQLMSNICKSLTNFNNKITTLGNKLKFVLEKLNLKNYITIHFRFGDRHKSTDNIHNENTNFKIVEILKKYYQNENIIIMCDRKDHNILKELEKNYQIIYSDNIIDKLDFSIFQEKEKDVIKFLVEFELLKNGFVFIGHHGSTVSNYMSYQYYLQNKPYEVHNIPIKQELFINKYSWNNNKRFGAGISWQVFWRDNIIL